MVADISILNTATIRKLSNNTSEAKHFPKNLDRRIRCYVCSIKKLQKLFNPVEFVRQRITD